MTRQRRTKCVEQLQNDSFEQLSGRSDAGKAKLREGLIPWERNESRIQEALSQSGDYALKTDKTIDPRNSGTYGI